MMKVLFRADASVTIGTGHIMRCLSLARELAAKGTAITFICRTREGDMSEYIRSVEGFPVITLPELPTQPLKAATKDEGVNPAHSDWLGTDWRTDSEQTIAATRSYPGQADWLVVDHYALDHKWEKALRPTVRNILVIDDLADRIHDCDALIDQNLYPLMESRYGGKVRPGCHQLLGPSYALLRDEFQSARNQKRLRDGTVKRILVFFGGADPSNETDKTLNAWEALNRNDLELDVVVGGNNPHFGSIRERCQKTPGLNYHFQARNMAELMSNADLALGAGGTATWERCCLSLPTLCISIAENQKLLAETAHSRGILRYLGHFDAVGVDRLVSALEECLHHPDELAKISCQAGTTVDGHGVRRVANFMMALKAETGVEGGTALRLRPTVPDDMRIYHQWANDPLVRAGAFNQDPIPLVDHERWFSRKLMDQRAGLYVLERANSPVGQIRFDITEEGVEIDFSVAEAFRGLGLSVELLNRGLLDFQSRHSRPLVFLGQVKVSNQASSNAFLRAGFTILDSKSLGGEPCLVFRKILTDPS